MENSINEEKIKRFGKITLLDIDTDSDCGFIRICSKNNYIDSIIISFEEVRSLSLLLYNNHDITIHTSYNSFYYYDEQINIHAPLVSLKFARKDFIAFGNYIYELVKGEPAYGE